MDDRFYWSWLGSLAKISTAVRSKLLCHFKEPEKIYYAGLNELKDLEFMDAKIYSCILDNEQREKAHEGFEKTIAKGIEIITLRDERYPKYLREIYDPPAALYSNGILKGEELLIGIVGSRRATSYGMEIAGRFAYELSQRGLSVISGMARGIDSAAHEGALQAGKRTVAVLGSGIDITYPPENHRIKKDIEKNGAVISEYLAGVPPLPQHFPLRNRIISGASIGTLIVEAGRKSGSLITANTALEQGREVFAVPGRINNNNSQGTNILIREGAKIVTCVEDIIDELENSYDICGKNEKTKGSKKKIDISAEEIKLVMCLKSGAMHIDKLSRLAGFEMGELNSLLLMLEMKGIVEQLPGKQFKIRTGMHNYL